jgi:RimJ/RimL family protein N-acetyltransferase
MKVLETERLILRKWQQENLKLFASLNACRYVCEFFPHVLNESESNDLAQKIMSHFDKHRFGLFAATRKDTKEFIGFAGLNIPDFDAEFMPAT